MFTKLTLITEKKNTVVKNLCTKNFQTCKKDVIFVLIFKKLQKKNISIFLTSCKKSFNFFDITRKVFQLF